MNPKKYSPDEIKAAHGNLLANNERLNSELKQSGKELYVPDWALSARKQYFRKR